MRQIIINQILNMNTPSNPRRLESLHRPITYDSSMCSIMISLKTSHRRMQISTDFIHIEILYLLRRKFNPNYTTLQPPTERINEDTNSSTIQQNLVRHEKPADSIPSVPGIVGAYPDTASSSTQVIHRCLGA